MAQVNDWSLDNLPGISFRAQANGVISALQSSNSGATAPSPTVAGMLWFDTGVSPVVPRQRNAANTAWNRIIDTADIAASRSALGAPPLPQTATGAGQWVILNSGFGNALNLPSGGTWAFFHVVVVGGGGIVTHNATLAAGGTQISSAVAGQNTIGFAWRIS